MRKIFMLSLILVFSSLFAFAQQPPSPEKMQKEMERMRQETEKIQKEEMERLKKDNPQLYQQRKDALDTQTKISAILSAFRQGKLSASSAESQLYSLVKQSMQVYINNLGTEIARLEKKLQSLKEAKNKPDLLIKKRINELLGKSMPSPE